MDEGIGYRSCWTNRRLPTNPTGRPVDRTNVPFESAQEIDARFSLDWELNVQRKTKTQIKTQMQIEMERRDPL